MPLLSKTHFPLQITGFDALYGLEVVALGEDEATARVAVRPELLQPGGPVHGGVYASIAESLASIATGKAVSAEGKRAQGLSNQTSFLRPILAGTIHATARRRHRGRTTWVWEVGITDDEGRPCALVRMTVAVRDTPSGVTGLPQDKEHRGNSPVRSRGRASPGAATRPRTRAVVGPAGVEVSPRRAPAPRSAPRSRRRRPHSARTAGPPIGRARPRRRTARR